MVLTEKSTRNQQIARAAGEVLRQGISGLKKGDTWDELLAADIRIYGSSIMLVVNPEGDQPEYIELRVRIPRSAK